MGLFDKIRATRDDVIKKATAFATGLSAGITEDTKDPTDTTKKPKQKTKTTRRKEEERPRQKAYKPSDIDIVTWSGNGGISFFVKPTKVQGVTEMNIEASANTEEKEENGEKFAKKKTNGAIQITIKAVLNAFLGADVQAVATKAIEAARKGDCGYFYSYGKKLYTCQFMMIEAKAQNILMSGTGKWVSCELNMTLKQATKAGGGDGGGGGSGGGGGGGGKGKKTYTATVYYSTGSGYTESVTRTSTISQADAEKKAWAAVPRNAHWASLNPKQAVNKDKAKELVQTTTDAKEQSKKVLLDSKRTTVGQDPGGGAKVVLALQR